jgi:hypothetical protein
MRRKKKRIPSGAKPRVYPKKLVPSSYPGSSSRDLGDYISWRRLPHGLVRGFIWRLRCLAISRDWSISGNKVA